MIVALTKIRYKSERNRHAGLTAISVLMNIICSRHHYNKITIDKSMITYENVNLTKTWPRKHRAGGRLNKKDGLTRYGDSHVKDKTS